MKLPSELKERLPNAGTVLTMAVSIWVLSGSVSLPRTPGADTDKTLVDAVVYESAVAIGSWFA